MKRIPESLCTPQFERMFQDLAPIANEGRTVDLGPTTESHDPHTLASRATHQSCEILCNARGPNGKAARWAMRQEMGPVTFAFLTKMIPLSFQRAWSLFGSSLTYSEFVDVVDKNPHHWRDAEVVRETAFAAEIKAKITGEAQSFIVRIRKADEDAGLEFVSLVFVATGSSVFLKEVI